MTYSMSRVTAWVRQRLRVRWSPIRKSRRRQSSVAPRDQGAGHLCLRHPHPSALSPRRRLRIELHNWVRREIGPIATPDFIQWAPSLPKTRSGKIMRRILRKIARANTTSWATSPRLPSRVSSKASSGSD